MKGTKMLVGIWIMGLVLFFFCPRLPAEVLSVEQKDLYAVYLIGPQETPSLAQIITNFGPGNIHLLDRIDIVLDQEGRVAGLGVVYTTADGFKRHVFFPEIKGWVFQEIRPGAQGKRITIRVITTQELNRVE